MFKLVVTDVDGTLLNQDSELSELNKKAIEDCINAGIKIVIATGKTFYAIENLINQFNLQLPQITLGGAVTVINNNTIIDSIKISESIYHDIINSVRPRKCEPLINTVEGKIYCQEFTPNMNYSIERGEKIHIVQDIEDKQFASNSVVISLPIPHEDPLETYIRDMFFKKVRVVRSGTFLLDLLNINASKGNALRKLLKNLGILKNEVISLGDSQNDISLFNESGFSVAVKNAYSELINIADAITDTNDNSGFGKAIYKYVLLS